MDEKKGVGPGHFFVLLFLIILLGRTCNLEFSLDQLEDNQEKILKILPNPPPVDGE